jgi:competence protein ComEA
MDQKGNHIKKWFGYNRRERRATTILLMIVVIVFVSRYLVPGRPAEVINLTNDIVNYDPGLLFSNNMQTDSVKLVSFDPNKATSNELKKLGLNEKQVSTIINYRNAGGRFYKPSDFAKIYGIDQMKIEELLPYILIDNKDEPGISKFKIMEQEKINLNTCDSTMLDKLPGIGLILSARIIKYRNLLGGYSDINQLKEVYGISEETYALISGKVYADSILVEKIKINRATYKDLIRHPYFENYEVTSILKFIEIKGRIESLDELINNKIISADKAQKILPYLSFE